MIHFLEKSLDYQNFLIILDAQWNIKKISKLFVNFRFPDKSRENLQTFELFWILRKLIKISKLFDNFGFSGKCQENLTKEIDKWLPRRGVIDR